MKKKPKTVAKRVGACVGAAAISAAMLTGCNWFSPEDNEPQDVYGPPLDWEDGYRPEDELPEPVYGPPPEDLYDPADEEIECVYGPPEDFGLEEPVEGEQP